MNHRGSQLWGFDMLWAQNPEHFQKLTSGYNSDGMADLINCRVREALGCRALSRGLPASKSEGHPARGLSWATPSNRKDSAPCISRMETFPVIIHSLWKVSTLWIATFGDLQTPQEPATRQYNSAFAPLSYFPLSFALKGSTRKDTASRGPCPGWKRCLDPCGVWVKVKIVRLWKMASVLADLK